MTRLSRRHFMATSAAAGASLALARPALAMANDTLNLGFISCGGRAGQLMQQFASMSDVNIAALCDPDSGRLSSTNERFPRAKAYADLRELIDDSSIDAVVVATSNHWHCLASIWAMQAGKDVYVEKPLSHNQWEGRQTVAAAEKLGRVCAIGTQQRSDPMQAEIKRFLHEEKALGEIQSARVNRYGVRGEIGKRSTPLAIPSNVDYELWLGPGEDRPILRNKLQYDWHWDWNTGSGEMGNWGVHVLDDLRNNVFQDQVSLPKRIMGGGGRVVYNDAGETPNVHFVYFDTGSIPVVIGLSNLPAAPGAKGSPKHPGPGSGYVAYCEGGRLEGQRGSATAFDADGKVVKRFQGDSGQSHQRNFVEAVQAGDASLLNADVRMGHYSTGWCNLANVAFRAGTTYRLEEAQAIDDPNWSSLLDEMREHLGAYDLPLDGPAMRMSSVLDFDVDQEVFVGDNAAAANEFMRRKYRAPFEVPTIEG